MSFLTHQSVVSSSPSFTPIHVHDQAAAPSAAASAATTSSLSSSRIASSHPSHQLHLNDINTDEVQLDEQQQYQHRQHLLRVKEKYTEMKLQQEQHRVVQRQQMEIHAMMIKHYADLQHQQQLINNTHQHDLASLTVNSVDASDDADVAMMMTDMKSQHGSSKGSSNDGSTQN